MKLTKLPSNPLTALATGVALAALATPVLAENVVYTPTVINYTTAPVKAPDLQYGYIETARANPQVIMAGVSPSVIDENDTSFEIVALVRPGKNPLQGVTFGQGDSALFIKNLKPINTLKNGDQFWSATFTFDKGAFGSTGVPVKWGNGSGQMYIRATDSASKPTDSYKFPVIQSGNYPAQTANLDTTKNDTLAYAKTKRAVPQVIMAGTSPAIVDLLDSSFDIVTIVRPGVVPLKSVQVKQGNNLTFSFNMEKKKVLNNGDQIWAANLAFTPGTFATSTIPVVWGNDPGEYSIQVTDIADQVSTAYPLLRSGAFPAQ